jgi:hypothetical protein
MSCDDVSSFRVLQPHPPAGESIEDDRRKCICARLGRTNIHSSDTLPGGWGCSHILVNNRRRALQVYEDRPVLFWIF